ncbi:MAG: Elongation factor 2 [Promethearchaeota archaeon]|nr:MAG: Elongation factor 2 [Candidatus Lokiarchaeota archaeon]
MAHRKDITEILKLMENPKHIRNIGLVGHIDHGKTTLSDSLLSEAGLLNPDLAGEARVLDYLEEEQQRGITMKSTNISLYYEKSLAGHEPFLINLIDTPGHLDFSGKVTRALRLIDGVVVVVDAVEEIISQSETVIRQAIDEGVKPILFINKVDRLVRELKLTDDQIRKKYSRIINDFNKQIERYAPSPFDKEWQVSPADGNVAFGSALHKWGFTLNILKQSQLNFSAIRKRYKKETYSKETYSDLAVYLPIDKAILEMIVNHLPNPLEAQKYRIQEIWSGDMNSQIGKALLECDPQGPLIICVSKVQADKHGLIATGRVFSGKCSEKMEMTLLRENTEERIQKLALFMGQRREQVTYIPVGNIVALEGLKHIKSGETLIEKEFMGKMIPFGNVNYVTTPVITVSIEPEYLRELNEMKEIISNLLIEDPNLRFEINEENGEFLLSGMGTLHLEVTANEISKRGVEVSISEPRAVFKESCQSESSTIEAVDSSHKNFVYMKVERLDEEQIEFFSNRPLEALLESEQTSLTQTDLQQVWNFDEDQNLLVYQAEQSLDEFYSSLIKEIINKIHLNGPLCGEKITKVKFVIKDVRLSNLDKENAFTELSILFYDAIKRGLNEAQMVLFEPIYHTIIQLPPKYIKSVLSSVSKYSAKILEVIQENEYQATIELLIPVRHSINFGRDIRSLTSGRAFWQNEFYSFMEVPSHEADRIIADLRFRKGLSW